MPTEHSTDCLGRPPFLMCTKRMEQINNAVFQIWWIPTVLFTDLKGHNWEIFSVQGRSIKEKHNSKTDLGQRQKVINVSKCIRGTVLLMK